MATKHRSAVTGRYITRRAAVRNPRITVAETYRTKPCRPPKKK